MSAIDLVAQLAAAGTPPELLAAVAQELFLAETERGALASRRKNERDRKAKSREVTGQDVTERDVTAGPLPPLPPLKISPDPTKITPPISPKPNTELRAWALPHGVSLQVWNDFLTNRKRKRLPNTETAWKTFNDDLGRISSQTGIPPPKLIERCTAKGWASINDPREDGNGRSATNGMGRNQPSDGLSPTTRAARDVFGIAAGHQ